MLLELENVRKKYNDFDLNCSLQINEGMVTGLVGPNGAGKSTTFKAVMGLIKPDNGKINVFGKPVNELTAADKENVGVVLAEGGFNSYLCVKDIAAIMNSMYRQFEREKFIADCKKFDIPLDKPLQKFSTGMRAKIKLLSAMSYHARLLILDEPTSGLDVMARNELLDMLRNYMEHEECGVLISSHISSDLEGLCDDLYMINRGKIVLHEDTDVLLSDYGVLKVTNEQYEKLDKECILMKRNESYGYSCLTNQKQFYMENYPDIAIEKGSIDDIMMVIMKSE